MSKTCIYIFILYLFVFVLYGCAWSNKEEQAQPNILFILVDDQRNDMLSCAGHPILQTPTIDKLAKNGIRFNNAFVTTSICAASRASILTGLYEYKHGYTFGKNPIAQSHIKSSYPYLLRQAGYNTGFVGKLGVQMEQQDAMLDSMFNYKRITPKNAPHFITLHNGTKMHSAEIKGEQAIEFIKQQSEQQPFCLSISFNAVHAVDANKTPGNEGHYPYPEAVENMYANLKMPLPKLSGTEVYDKHPEFLKNSINRQRYFWRWDTPEKYQTNMRAYYRMISAYDKVMQRVIDALAQKNVEKNTIIIYMADNGYYMGERGFAGKWSHFEESIRVPMVIYDPRMPKKLAGKTTNKMALNIDIASTILDYAGVNQPLHYQGRSLISLLKNVDCEDWRNDFFIEHRMEHDKIPKYVGVRGERFVYARYYDQNPVYEYLHDLHKDPNELENFATHSDYRDVMESMRRRCIEIE